MLQRRPAIITIYTDGSCYPNPGPGGWAAIILLPRGIITELDGLRLNFQGAHELHLYGHEDNTTNNRMELLAAICALEHLPNGYPISLYTDSQYVNLGITEWIEKWRHNNWRTRRRSPIQNVDLWLRLIAQRDYHQITWNWVRGHSGDRLNTKVDGLAMRARERRIQTILHRNDARITEIGHVEHPRLF